MKKFLIAPVIMFILASCSEADKVAPTSNNVASTGNMVASLNGSDWKAVTADAEVLPRSFAISGAGLNNVVITLEAQGEAKIGTYAISKSTSTCSIMLCPTDKVTYTPDDNASESGTLTISEIDATNHTISGTFNSVVTADGDEVKITTGVFNKVPYFSPSGSAPNSVTTTIQGETFQASGSAIKTRSNVDMTFNGADGKTILISVPNNPEAALGLHSFSKSGFYTALYIQDGTEYEAVSGTVNITKFDPTTHRLEGTFFFKSDKAPANPNQLVYDPSLTAEEGAFMVTYYYQ